MRELAVLGTASQVPTRARNHNGYLLRWDGEGLLFDPGEGTQRQMIHAGISAARITRSTPGVDLRLCPHGGPGLIVEDLEVQPLSHRI